MSRKYYFENGTLYKEPNRRGVKMNGWGIVFTVLMIMFLVGAFIYYYG